MHRLRDRLSGAAWVLLAVLLLVALPLAAGAGAARHAAGTPPARWTLTRAGLQHITARHFHGSTATHAGKYTREMSNEEQLRKLINATFHGETPEPQDKGRWKYEHTFDKTIGDVDIDGRPADLRTLRLILAPDGTVITAFPVGRNER